MTDASNAVFVSYRRQVSQFLAQALWQNLTARGIDVFYDLETIQAGEFESIILAQIAARPYMIPVLQPGTLNRCDHEDDWVRREIEAAIAQDRMLVPVYTPAFSFEDIERYLPEETATTLRGFNMLEIPAKYFKYAIEELASNYLKPIRRELTPVSPVAAADAVRHAEVMGRAPKVTAERLTAEQHFARGFEAAMNARHRAAVESFNQAIDINPNYADALQYRSEERSMLDDDEGAAQDIEKAISLNPNSADAFRIRANLRDGQGDYEGALADYNEAIRLKPDEIVLYLGRASVRRHLRDLEGQLRDLDEAIRLDPDLAEKMLANQDREQTLWFLERGLKPGI